MSAGDTIRRAFVIGGLIAPAVLAGSPVFTQRGGRIGAAGAAGGAARDLRLLGRPARDDPARTAGHLHVQWPVHLQPDARSDLRPGAQVPAGADRHSGWRRLRRRQGEEDGRDRHAGRGAGDARGVPRRTRLHHPRARSDVRRDQRAAVALDAAATRRSEDDAVAGRRCRGEDGAAVQCRSGGAPGRVGLGVQPRVARTGHAQPAGRAGQPDHSRAIRAGRGRDDEDADVVDGEEPGLDALRHSGRSRQAAARRAARHRMAARTGPRRRAPCRIRGRRSRCATC